MELSGEEEADRRLPNLCFLPALSHSGQADSGIKVRTCQRPPNVWRAGFCKGGFKVEREQNANNYKEVLIKF